MGQGIDSHAETENNRRGADSNAAPGHALGVEGDWEK